MDPPLPSVPSDRPISTARSRARTRAALIRPVPDASASRLMTTRVKSSSKPARPAKARVASTTASTRFRERMARVPPDDVLEAIDAEHLARTVHDLDDAVGVQHEDVAGLDRCGARDERGRIPHAQRRAAAGEHVARPAGAEQQRRVVPAVGEGEGPGAGLEQAVDRGDEAGRVHRVEQDAVEPARDRIERGALDALGPERRPEGRHDERRRHALPGHVGDRDAEAAVRLRQVVEVVAADLPRRHVGAGDVVAVQHGVGRRQQGRLHLLGDAELLLDAVLLEHLAVEDRLLDGDGGRHGEELQELDVRFRERVQRVALEVQRADDVAAAHDRHGDLGAGRRLALRRSAGSAARPARSTVWPVADHVADDAFAAAQHRVLVAGRVVESHRGHAGNHAPARVLAELARAG